MSGARGLARRVGANALRAMKRPFSRGLVRRDGGLWLAMSLTGPLPEWRPRGWLGAGFPGAGADARPTLLEALRMLDAAAVHPDVAGVWIRLGDSLGGLAAASALQRAVAAVRAAGRTVIAGGPVLSTTSLLVASAASEVWMPPAGSVPFVGLRSEAVFLRDLLAKIGARVEVLRVGTHKTAGEIFTRDGLSPEQREQIEAFLDDAYASLVDAIAEGRGLDGAAVRALVDAGPYGAEAARAAGLVDRVLPGDAVLEALEARFAGSDGLALVDGLSWLRWRVDDPGWEPLGEDIPRVAYVVASGPVLRGEAPSGIADRRYARLLDELADDPATRGIVLRIDSPGGDAIASDALWHTVERTTWAKPVVVSMGEVAASGGYYMAAPADVILAEATTLTGSIGVVGGKLDLEGVYRRFGVGHDGVERGARAGIFSATRGFTPDEERALRGTMRAAYRTFVDRVAEGRGLDAEDVAAVAEGRIWSGRRALERRLVDAIGGPLEAIAAVRRCAELPEDAPVRVRVHGALPPFGGLLARFAAARTSRAAAACELAG